MREAAQPERKRRIGIHQIAVLRNRNVLIFKEQLPFSSGRHTIQQHPTDRGWPAILLDFNDGMIGALRMRKHPDTHFPYNPSPCIN